MPLLADYHGGDMEGAFLTDATQRDGWRCSTEKAFLRPARERANLTIMTRSQADTITFDGRRATGVQITRNGRQSTVRARREILICAGTVGSAALLLRSGIGPGAPLQALGITSRHDLPGVGTNLQEHQIGRASCRERVCQYV